MLAAESSLIEIGQKTFELRFPLRAALRLVRRYPDLSKLLRDLAELRLEVLAVVISECSGERLKPENLFASLNSIRRYAQLEAMGGTLIQHVLALFNDENDDGGDGEAQAEGGERIPYETFYTDLFAMATSWPVGWSPEQAWKASPSEIIAATKAGHGFVDDVLERIFGKRDDAPAADKPKRTRPDTSPLDRDGLRALKGLGKW